MNAHSMDVLNAVSRPSASWSSVNLAEAVPGVMTPLTASLWVPASEMGLRMPFRAMGILTADDAAIPDDPRDRITGAFFGRMAVRVDFLCEMGDLIPGQSGDSLARDFFGFVPDDFVSRPSNRRLPAILARYPRTLATIARRMERQREDLDVWWRSSIAQVPSLTGPQLRALLAEAAEKFSDALALQAVVSACAIQLVHDQISSLAGDVGVEVTDLLRGHGSHEETTVLRDMWAISRDRLTVDDFLIRHGYHCAGEGETLTMSWREDPTPVTKIVAQFANLPDEQGPDHREAELLAMASAGEQRLRDASTASRPRIAVTLRLARRFIPLRGVGKVSYLQCLDVVRACARRLGVDGVARGVLGDSDDAFYLTLEELAVPLVGESAGIVAERREQRIAYESLRLPATWTGQPQPLTAPSEQAAPEVGARFEGIGASPGVVTGRAVVVDDPSDTDVEAGDILVARTTDPSWVSLMFLSSALVVDIGGMMSHAAVVARELGVPCVMNTGNGTEVITTGDTITVNGDHGTVEIVATSAELTSDSVG